METNQLTKNIYDAYCKAVGGKAFNGDNLPTSDEFFNDPTKEKQANAWHEAIKPTFDLLREVTSNLAHPAYGQSSSTTIAIDELRNRAFDFLGL